MARGMAIVSGAGFGGLGACASDGQSSTNAGQPKYVELFDQGRFAEAQSAAATYASSATGHDREEALLMAGLAAHARDHMSEAEPYLAQVVDSQDESISGKAEATLGLIALQRSQNDKAAELLSSASEKLYGDQAARAALYAGDAYRAQGKVEEAREQYEKA